MCKNNTAVYQWMKLLNLNLGQWAGAVEYTDRKSVEGQPPHEFPGYDSKQTDGEVPVIPGALGNAGNTFISIAPRSPPAQNGSTDPWVEKN